MDVVLPGESVADYERLRSAFWSAYHPAGPVEEALTDRAVSALWRLQRLERVEAGILVHRMNQLRREQLLLPVFDFSLFSAPAAQQEQESGVTDQNSDRTILGRAFATEAGPLMVLSRYEVALVRTLGLCIAQLEAKRGARLLTIRAERSDHVNQEESESRPEDR